MGSVLSAMAAGAIVLFVAAATLAHFFPYTAAYYKHPHAKVTADDIERLAAFVRATQPYENTEGRDPARDEALRIVERLREGK